MNLKTDHSSSAFVLIEVLIATSILAVVLLGVYSRISAGIYIVGNSRNYTRSMIIARSLMNEFRNDSMRGSDLHDVPVENVPDFFYDRITERYEQPFLGPVILNKTVIRVKWRYKGREEPYELMMIYQVK